jgi:hypothetical protein
MSMSPQSALPLWNFEKTLGVSEKLRTLLPSETAHNFDEKPSIEGERYFAVQRGEHYEHGTDTRTYRFDHIKYSPRFFAGHSGVYVWREWLVGEVKVSRKRTLTIIKLQPDFLYRRQFQPPFPRSDIIEISEPARKPRKGSLTT